MINKINAVLSQYGITIDNVVTGLRITQFSATLTPSAPVKKLLKLDEALSIALNNDNVTVERKGNRLVISVPTNGDITLCFHHVTKGIKQASGMAISLGYSVDNELLYTDLAKQPHMLVAGTTGGGKSMFLHNVILSLLIKDPITDIIAIDGKGSEFTAYADLPRFQYVKETERALETLQFLCREMDRRYTILAEHNWRDVTEAANAGHVFSDVVCIIDEFADLMLKEKAYAREIETCVVRLAQKARAAGIHLVIATQRPTKDVVTGLIKANIPCRVCFRTSSALESRIVLDRNGAEKLLDKGDMLFLGNGATNVIRSQAPLVTHEDQVLYVELLKKVYEQNNIQPSQPKPSGNFTTQHRIWNKILGR